MIYRQKFYDCGQYAEVEIFALPPHTRPLKRARKEKESTPARRLLNDNNSIKKFVRLANTNFHEGDFSVELTFNRYNLPESPEELNREVANYIRRVKYAMGQDAEKLKYLYVPSCKGKDGRKVRRHAHILITGVSREILAEKWKKGYVNIDVLQPDENGIEGKARYMAKQGGSGSKRWIGSRNLQAPEVQTSDNKITSSKAHRMYTRPDDKALFERTYKPWTFTECRPSIVEYDGSYYITIKLRKEKWQNEKNRGKHSGRKNRKKSVRNQNAGGGGKVRKSGSGRTGPAEHSGGADLRRHYENRRGGNGPGRGKKDREIFRDSG